MIVESKRKSPGMRPVWISSFASTPALTMNSQRPTLPSALLSARCSRRSSAAVYGSVSAGSMDIVRATFRPSRRPSLQGNRVMPVRYDDRDPDDGPDPLGLWRQGRDGDTGLLFCAQPATPGMAESPFKKRWADNVEAFGGQLQRVWFNDDVDLNRVN